MDGYMYQPRGKMPARQRIEDRWNYDAEASESRCFRHTAEGLYEEMDNIRAIYDDDGDAFNGQLDAYTADWKAT